MRFFYDSEFIEDGRTIELVSIGVVAEDGREYYAVSTEFDPSRAGDWVRANVLPKLPSPSSPHWRSRRQIREELLAFLTEVDDTVELWAWVGAYDHVVLCQLWGPMTALPRALPRFTRELKQRWEEAGSPALPTAPDDAHDALSDARHNARKWAAIERSRLATARAQEASARAQAGR
ncbi:MAG: polyadenylate-specific 3'-exoribonuclease AS [Gordonia sp. (in: high G+C Gram-positive bacteria)]